MNDKTKTFPLKYTPEELETVRRRAQSAGLSIQKYCRYMTIDGKLPKGR